MATPEYLTIADLQSKIGNRLILSYFSDSNGASLTVDELVVVNDTLAQAEKQAFSELRKAYSADQILDLVANDPALKSHVAWVAVEFSAERRPAFNNDEGRGPYWAQYQRAMDYFKAISKGQKRSAGEDVAGVTRQIGGEIQPNVPSNASRFIFSPDTKNPTGHGGF